MMLKWLHFFCVLVIFSFCGCSKNHESKEQGILIRGKIEDVDSEFRVIHFVKLDKEAQLKLEKLLVTKDEDWFAFEKKLWSLINTFDIKTAKIIERKFEIRIVSGTYLVYKMFKGYSREYIVDFSRDTTVILPLNFTDPLTIE